MSSLRCLHRPVVLFYILSRVLLHLSRTKRRNWKRKGGAIVKPRKAEAENRLYRVPQQQLSSNTLSTGPAWLDASDQ